jgi:hypothetical protein
MVNKFEPRTGNIAGQITDRDSGKPLFGVSVAVGASGVKSTTDLRGRYFISNVPAGDCVMRCSQPGYKTVSGLKLAVRPGETIQQDCRLVCKDRTPLNEPVVLLPLRLEIRKAAPQPNQTTLVANYSVNAWSKAYSLAEQFEPLPLKSEIQARVFQQTEYWIRWYPDTIQYLIPVGRITEAEKTAWREFFKVYEKHKEIGSVKGLYALPTYALTIDNLEIFYGVKPGRLSDDDLANCQAYDQAARELIRNEGQGVREALGWQDLENPEIKASWIAFAKAAGPVRARQIAKQMIDGNWDFDTEEGLDEEPLDILVNRGMRLTTLPEEISVYTVKDRQTSLLIDGIEINRDRLFVSPTDFAGSQWMTDFTKAVEEGMGIIVSDAVKVQQIDQADWLIVVGVNQTSDSRAVLQEIFRRHSANGAISILAQDSPTNNSESAPTPFSDMESDVEAYLQKTRMRISGEDATPDLITQIGQNRSDAQRLTQVFKHSQSALSEISGASSSEMTEAAAMAALLWTPCTWHHQQLWGGFFNQFFPVVSRFVQDLKLGDFFVNNVRARGALPVIRIQDNPYGVLPVVSLRDWSKNLSRDARISASDAENIFSFVDSFKNRFLSLSQQAPKLDLSTDEQRYETLVEILKSAPVSKRVDVRAFDSAKPADLSEDPNYLNCPLVKEDAEGKAPTVETPYPEIAYLTEFSHINRSDFNPDDFQVGENSSLFKRILKYLLDLAFTRVHPPIPPTGPTTTGGVAFKAAMRPGAPGPLEPAEQPPIKPPVKPPVVFPPPGTVPPPTPQIPGGLDLIAEAASFLKRVHPDKLEILLLETLDLFSHRLDAWFTGLANSILEECQRRNTQSPPVGVYGWLERPGQLNQRSIEPEFIQAPSVKQATTAAVLRNASIHNGTEDNSGAFQINLSSEQIRTGVWYMDGLRQGHLPGELLGYRLERMIHEESKKPNSPVMDTDIFELRDQYPLTLQEARDEAGEATGALTIIDGEKFLSDQNSPAKFAQIKASLNRIKDAAADIALCEVIDASDNVARQGGWMDFLDGDGLPPREEFIRSQRSGDVHATRVFLPIPSPANPEAEPAETNPRVIADPVLAHFCATLMPDFETKEIVANLTKIDGAQTRPITFLTRELKMQPIDLVIGGLEELKLRTRYHLLSCWKANDPSDRTSASPCNILGPFPDYEESDELLNEVAIELIPPAGSADQLSIFSYIEKARLIRQLIHRNQAKNSPGTVPPEDIPLLVQEQLDRLDPLAGTELLTGRLRRIRDRLIRLTSTTVANTAELKRRQMILRLIGECRTCLQKIRDSGPSGVAQLKAKVNNMIDSDPDFSALANQSGLLSEIDKLPSSGPTPAEPVDNLQALFSDLERRFIPYVERTAKALVSNPDLRMWEIGSFGLEQALTVLPDAPTVGASIKLLKLFDQLLSSLIDKLAPLIADSPAAQSNVQCLKVVYLNAVEVNEILASYKGADVAEQFKRRLPLTTEQAQMIAAQRFETASYFEPLIDLLLTDLNDFAQSRTTYEDLVSSLKTSEPDETNAQEEIVSTVKRTIPEVISLLQAATDGEGMVILTPYLLAEDQGQRADWILDLSQLQALAGPAHLNEYRKVRPAIANLFKLFNVGADLKLYEDKRAQRVKSDEALSKRGGNTDFLYLMPATGSPSRMKCLTVLLIDQWQEGIPNPEGAEMTGIALRFDSPQTEAPNAMIIATPPYLSGSEFWNAELLASTIFETIELMQIRIVGSDELRGDAHLNSLFHLPALLFPPAKDGSPLFPSRPQLFHGFDLGALSGYVLASKLTAVDLSQTTPTSARSDTPKIGGKK